MPEVWNAGVKYSTVSGETGGVGVPIKIFDMHIIGDGVAAPVVTVSNNGSGGTIYIKETGAATATGKTFDYGSKGQLFPLGAYVTVDAHTVSVTVSYSQ